MTSHMAEITAAPVVSIVIPVRDTPEPWLRTAVASALGQRTWFPFEVLLCDDASSPDGAAAIAAVCADVEDLAGGRLGTLRFVPADSEWRGPGLTRHRGVQHARGEYLLWLDSDDELPPDTLDALLALALHTGASMVISQCVVSDEGIDELRDPKPYVDLCRRFHNTQYDPLVQVVFSIQAQLVLRTAYDRVEGFSPEYPFAEVTEFFLRLVRAEGIERLAVLERPGYVYHRRPESYSTLHRDLFLKYRAEALNDHLASLGWNDLLASHHGRSSATGAQHYQLFSPDGVVVPPWRERFGRITPPDGVSLAAISSQAATDATAEAAGGSETAQEVTRTSAGRPRIRGLLRRHR